MAVCSTGLGTTVDLIINVGFLTTGASCEVGELEDDDDGDDGESIRRSSCCTEGGTKRVRQNITIKILKLAIFRRT